MKKSAPVDYKILFQSIPGLYMILKPDLTICEVSDAYAKATLINRDEVIGRHLFEVFPDNPDDASADGVSNLHASLLYVLRHKTLHIMPVQKYDVRRTDGTFEERYWSPGNRPVMDDNGEIVYIIHNATDVTYQQKTEQRLKRSEKDHQLLVNNIKDYAIFFLDTHGRIATWNVGAQTVTGYSNEDVLGQSMEIFYTREESKTDVPEMNLQEALRERHLEGEGWRVRKDKSRFYASTTLTPLFDDYREFSGYAVIIQDVTERKQADNDLRRLNDELEERVKERTRLLHEANALARIGSWELDVATSKVYWSDITRELHETAPDFMPMLADGISFYKEGYSRDIIIKKVEEAFESGARWDEEVQIVTKKKNERWVRVIGEADFVDGKCVRMYGSFQDIDQRKKAQLEVIELNEQLEQKVLQRTDQLKQTNDELESFTYSVSHDLRAPLRIISGYASILHEDYASHLDDDAKRIIDSMGLNAKKMGQLIDDLLHFSRLSRRTITKTSVDTNTLVQGVVEELEAKSDETKIEWTIHPLPPSFGDFGTLRQVWINIISNAVKYSSKVTHPTIEIGFDDSLPVPAFFVKDNGAGFDMQYSNKLFGVFQRLHKPAEFEGTGVGLAIVDKVVRKHGGKVWGEGKVGEGAVFYFTLT